MQKKQFSNTETLRFVFIICFACALILSVLTAALKPKQEEAEALYKSKQLLIAANLMSFEGTFQLPLSNGGVANAAFDKNRSILMPTQEKKKATNAEILTVYQTYITPCLTNNRGDLFTFQQANVDMASYMRAHQKSGYSTLPYKLIYLVRYTPQNSERLFPADGYVIPINGQGLWDAIYGYLCLGANADTIIGATWYEQAETPGLGGDISLPYWLAQLRGKVVFQKGRDGSTNFAKAPLGITVVKGTVKDIFGTMPKGQSAVDGISGATITGKGVTEAYADCLKNYRPFLLRAHQANGS